MIDNWFKKDLDKIYASNQIAVFINVSGEPAFLYEHFKKGYTFFETQNDVDELKAKYAIEKNTRSR